MEASPFSPSFLLLQFLVQALSALKKANQGMQAEKLLVRLAKGDAVGHILSILQQFPLVKGAAEACERMGKFSSSNPAVGL